MAYDAETASAYELPTPGYERELVETARGTPAGELLRRYWQPVALASEVTDIPHPVRALGEDLILFRTPDGRLGLVHARCAHRGTNLLYGKVEQRGIRCCYHGWLFDTDGACLEQPCEPGGGQKRELHRQPWYPVEERYGLVFAYMGPAERRPVLPRYDILEHLPTGHRLVANGDSIGSGGPDRMPCNWFQTHENVMDPFHVFVLHASFSTSQFNALMDIRPEISWDLTEHGVCSYQLRALPDGQTFRRVTEVLMPNLRIVADPFVRVMGQGDNVAWTLPIDDHNTRIFTVYALAPDAPKPRNGKPMYGGKTWFELDGEGHQRFPGDFEAQVGQGVVTWHSQEHLASSDRGVALFRRQFRQAVQTVRSGEDPPGVVRAGEALVLVRAGNFVVPREVTA